MNYATQASLYVNMAGAALLVFVSILLSARQHRLHPLLLGCVAGLSISWIEAPYDWATYAQFPPELPRMPQWWPVNWTWGGGVPSSVPLGYIFYMVFPALLGVALSRALVRKFGWTQPLTLLTVGLIVGFLSAFFWNGMIFSAHGVTYYGRVIPSLAIREGTIQQYPLYDSVAMGVQMMAITYLMGRVDATGRTFVSIWADAKTHSRSASNTLAIAAVIVMANIVYLSVFAPHYVTKVMHLQTAGSSQQLFPGVPNQPL